LGCPDNGGAQIIQVCIREILLQSDLTLNYAWASGFSRMEWWTGTLEWNDGMDWNDGIVGWNIK